MAQTVKYSLQLSIFLELSRREFDGAILESDEVEDAHIIYVDQGFPRSGDAYGYDTFVSPITK